MVNVISRLCVLAGCLFGVGYGLACMMKKSQQRYFFLSFIGLFAVFLSRLFYLILTISHGDDSAFSVGVFGQITAYLFFTVANCAFLPASPPSRRFCAPGMVAAVVPAMVFLYIAASVHTFGAILCEVLYLVTICPAVYHAVRIISQKKENKAFASVTPFNLCLCGLVYIFAGNEILFLLPAGGSAYVSLGLAVLSGVLLALMLPLLKKGTELWEASY